MEIAWSTKIVKTKSRSLGKKFVVSTGVNTGFNHVCVLCLWLAPFSPCPLLGTVVPEITVLLISSKNRPLTGSHIRPRLFFPSQHQPEENLLQESLRVLGGKSWCPNDHFSPSVCSSPPIFFEVCRKHFFAVTQSWQAVTKDFLFCFVFNLSFPFIHLWNQTQDSPCS